jgi:hypothetical protein
MRVNSSLAACMFVMIFAKVALIVVSYNYIASMKEMQCSL